MPISTGDYFEHINDSLLKTTYYTFTPKPLMNNELYTVDDELLSLVASTHKSLGILEGMSLYMPNQAGIRISEFVI